MSRVADYYLASKARHDLQRLWRNSVSGWGRVHADRCYSETMDVLGFLAEIPQIARLHEEFRPPVRLHPHGAHLIMYREEPPVLIVRILHHRQDWPAGP